MFYILFILIILLALTLYLIYKINEITGYVVYFNGKRVSSLFFTKADAKQYAKIAGYPLDKIKIQKVTL